VLLENKNLKTPCSPPLPFRDPFREGKKGQHIFTIFGGLK